MNWDENSEDWPNAEFSSFVDVRPYRWFVQDAGTGPLVLLIHGAGGSCHSWRAVFTDLSKDHRVIAVDLPGQGFTKADRKSRLSLDFMSADIISLLRHMKVIPKAIIGHSAGAAIAFRMALDWPSLKSTRLVAINGALENFEGVAGVLFPTMAKLLALNPLTASVFSKTASRPATVHKLITGTGSDIGPDGLDFYQRLISDRDHVDGTLSMMANWSLTKLRRQLPHLEQETLFLAGKKDGAVPTDVSDEAARRVKNGKFVMLDDLGHLMHEEDPDRCTALIRSHIDAA
ncbi:alpha/beta fold hydrolase BchO [Litoreibacter roseus]|uniref:Magnesium chelatase n=1 Tax=Litoreibacter roseus TaxID=2601869 RepID=A0A6N6JFN2_9RHOB|nr:alpha/beta fold hydrolase BchO [Litoreibacter roseus]GFE64600.1 magnesium chelatase [Litoreibacter roseus]